MDEIFGSVGFASDDLARKQKIEDDIGLTALLNGGSVPDETLLEKAAFPDTKAVSGSDHSNEALPEKAAPEVLS
jgi:hypothetical protein